MVTVSTASNQPCTECLQNNEIFQQLARYNNVFGTVAELIKNFNPIYPEIPWSFP